MQSWDGSASRVAVSSATLQRGAAPASVNDIVSRYVLNATLPSERAAKGVPRSSTPPARTGLTSSFVNSSGLVYSPATSRLQERNSDIRRSEQHLSDLRAKMERAGRHAEDVAATVKDLERSKTILSDLENENLQLRTRVRTLSLIVEEKEQSLKEMENALRNARSSLAETEELRVQDMTNLRRQIGVLQNENNELASRCDNLRVSITNRDSDTSISREELRVRLNQLETQLETSRNTNFRLSHQLEEREHQMEELHKLQAEIPRLETQAKDTMQKLQDTQKLVQTKEEERLALQDQHLRQLRDLAEQLDSWKREMNRLSERGFEHQKMHNDNASRATMQDRQLLAEISDSVRSGIDEMRRRQAEVERLQIDIHRLQDENRLLRETAAGKDFMLNEANMLKAQVRQLQENVSLLQQLNAELKGQIEKKEAVAEVEASAHLAEVEHLKKELGSAKSEISALDSIKKENAKLRKEIHRGPKTEKVEELSAEKSVLEHEVTELREKLIGMTANAIQVERIYAEQLDDLQKEVAQLRLKEAECRTNHLNPEREAQLQSRTLEIEAENEMLRQRMEANLRLQNELDAEKRKETIKREQQLQLQAQLGSLNFAKPDPAAGPAKPQNLPRAPNFTAGPQQVSAADMYVQRLHRAGGPFSATSPAPSAAPQRPSPLASLQNSPNNTEEVNPAKSSPLHRMTSSLDARGQPASLPSATSFSRQAVLSSVPSMTAGSPNQFDRTVTYPSFVQPTAGSNDNFRPVAAGNKNTQAATIRYTSDGVGSIQFGTMSQLFLAATEGGGNTVAIKTEDARHRNEDPRRSSQITAMEWCELTWQAYYVKAAQFAKALVSHRCEANATVLIISSGSAEASIAFMGSVLAGCLPSPAATASPIATLVRQIEETAAEIIVLDDVPLLQRLLSATRRVSSIKQFVLFDSQVPQVVKSEFGQMVATFDQFLALCAYVTDTVLQTRIDGQSVDQPACIVYTSGTTGDPRGVLLSHDNLQFAAAAFAQSMVLTDGDSVSHLSLVNFAEAHGVVVDVVLPMITLASKGMPFVTHFVKYNGDPLHLPQFFRSIRPTFFFASPSVYQDVLTCIRASEGGSKNDSDTKLQQWAKTISREASFQRQRDVLSRLPSGPIKGAHLAASLNDKIKSSVGLDRVVQTICAGGPVTMPLLEAFASFGFDLLQLYVSAETTGVATASAEACFQFGTCGFPLPSTELHIDASSKASDRSAFREGELVVRGRHVMIGYLTHNGGYRGPDAEGWLRTGDLGRMDSESGLLTLVGRIKDQVILYPSGLPMSATDRVSPQRVELEILRICAALSHVVVFGDQRKFLVALMTLKSKRNPLTGTFTDDLCGEALEVNPEVLTVTTARRDDKWLKCIAGVIAQCNSVVENQFLKVKRFCILPTDFSVIGGELTVSNKVKRAAVATKYSALIDKLYAEETGTPRK